MVTLPDGWRWLPDCDAAECTTCGTRALAQTVARYPSALRMHACGKRGHTVPAMLQPNETVVPRDLVTTGLANGATYALAPPRGFVSFPPGPQMAAALTDGELRAECERRWPNATNWAMWRKAEQERDDWKRRAEASDDDLMKLGWAPPLKSERWESLVRENAELVRRAELAEADAKSEGRRVEGRDGELDATRAELAEWKRRALAEERHRATPSRATKPDNELWGPTLEDLVAGDA